jgi:hypothetical protein
VACVAGRVGTSRLNNAGKLLTPRRKRVLSLFKLWVLAGFDPQWPNLNLVVAGPEECHFFGRKRCYVFRGAGCVVWFAPFNAKACEALAARLRLLPLRLGRSLLIVNDLLMITFPLRE